jgi:hypothetical protein
MKIVEVFLRLTLQPRRWHQDTGTSRHPPLNRGYVSVVPVCPRDIPRQCLDMSRLSGLSRYLREKKGVNAIALF